MLVVLMDVTRVIDWGWAAKKIFPVKPMIIGMYVRNHGDTLGILPTKHEDHG